MFYLAMLCFAFAGLVFWQTVLNAVALLISSQMIKDENKVVKFTTKFQVSQLWIPPLFTLIGAVLLHLS